VSTHRINENKLQAVKKLPTLPTIATQLLELLGHVEVSMQEISRLMEVDPAITAQILKVANSAYYGLRSKVDTVPRALVVLGVNEITNIILSLSLFKSFPNAGASDFDRKAFWTHSGVVGFLSRFFAQRFAVPTHGEEFTAGLMHDIGKIVLDQYFHEAFHEAIVQMEGHTEPGWQIERNLLGMNHADVGAWLGTRWEIPQNILEAVARHHEPQGAGVIAALVHLADLFAIRAGYGCNDRPQDIAASPAWGMLKVDYASLDHPDLDYSIQLEIEKAAEFLTITLPKLV